MNPGASEVADDGIDNDCDGQVDESAGTCAPTVTTYIPKEEASTARPNIMVVFTSECDVNLNTESIVMTVDDVAVTPTISGDGSDI